LKIENVKATTTRTGNTVSWTLNNPAAIPELIYGTSRAGTINQADISKLANGTYSVNLTDLKPGTLYYYTIKASTADNLQGASYTGVITTRGYPVQLTIEQNNLYIPGAKVRIGERTFIANENAIVSTELSDGKHTATITPADSKDSYTVDFTVAKKSIPLSGNPETQGFVLNINTVGTSSGLNAAIVPMIIGGVLAVATVIGILFGIFALKRRKDQSVQNPSVDTEMLMASYGNSAQEYRAYTPQPNLDSQGIAPTGYAPEQQYNPPFDDANTPPPMIGGSPTSPPNESLPAAPGYGTPMAAAIPAMPGATSVVQDSTAAITTDQSMQPSYSESEQLSPEISQVESVQSSDGEEPSAIYDASTGELDIIHHHSSSSTPVAALEPEPTMAVSEPPVPSIPTIDPASVQAAIEAPATPEPVMPQGADTPQIPEPPIVQDIPQVAVPAAPLPLPEPVPASVPTPVAPPAPIPLPAPVPIAASAPVLPPAPAPPLASTSPIVKFAPPTPAITLPTLPPEPVAVNPAYAVPAPPLSPTPVIPTVVQIAPTLPPVQPVIPTSPPPIVPQVVIPATPAAPSLTQTPLSTA
jgi:hypothetical protein